MGKQLELKCSDPQLLDGITRAKGVIIGAQSYAYGSVLYPPPEVKFAEAIGIVQKGCVEVQDRIPSYIRTHQSVLYPVALIEEGEVLGELEFLSKKYNASIARKPPWQAVAGVQSFYVTLLKRSKERLLRYVQSDLSKAAKNYQCEVVWLDAGKLDGRGLEALQRIALQRMLPGHFTWIPSDAALRRVLGSKITEKTERAFRLCREVLRAMQGSRMVFTPCSLQEITKLGPWETQAVATLGKEVKNAPDGLVILRPALFGQKLNCGIILPHFLANTMLETDAAMGLVPSRTGSLNHDVSQAFNILAAFMENEWSEAPHLRRFDKAMACFLEETGNSKQYRCASRVCGAWKPNQQSGLRSMLGMLNVHTFQEGVLRPATTDESANVDLDKTEIGCIGRASILLCK